MQRLLAAGAVLVLLSPPSVAATASVAVHDNSFEPRRITARVGDAVAWTSVGTRSGHNVRQNRNLFYSGRETTELDFSVVFSAGTFPYFCEAHGTRTTGMRGSVRIPVALARKPAGRNFTVRWATRATETGARFDVQYRVGSGSWRPWKKATKATKAVFGKDASPVKVRSGTRYRFRARSRTGNATSGWSPVAAFTP